MGVPLGAHPEPRPSEGLIRGQTDISDGLGMSETCCICPFSGTERAVRAHLAKVHPNLIAPAVAGRAAGPTCHLCGYVHDPIDRPGWATRRRTYSRGKIAKLAAAMDSRKGSLRLGEVRVPKGVTHVSGVSVLWEPCIGPYVGAPDDQGRRFCQKDGRYHHLVPKPGERIYYTLTPTGAPDGEVVIPIVFGEGGAYRAEAPVELRKNPALRALLQSLAAKGTPS